MTLNRTERDRPRARSSARSPTPTRCTRARAWRPSARVAEISGRNRTHFCGAYWGWGFHEDGVVSALRVAERFGARAVSGQRHLRGHDPPPARRARAGVHATGWRWPTSTSRSCRRCWAGGCCARGPGCCASAAATTSATRVAAAGRRRPRPGRRAHRRTGPQGPIRLLTQLRSFGLCFNPVSFYYCFDERRRACERVLAEVTNTPWGERHAYLLLTARPARRVCAGASPRRCTSRRSWAWTTPTRRGRPARADAVGPHREPARGRCGVRRDAGLAAPPLTRGAVAADDRALPAGHARVLALIYGHAVGLKLRAPASTPIPDGRTVIGMSAAHRPGSGAGAQRCCCADPGRQPDHRRGRAATDVRLGRPGGHDRRPLARGSGACSCAAAAGWPSPTRRASGTRPTWSRSSASPRATRS